MQCRFMLWKGTVDAVLGLRRLAEKSKSKNKLKLWESTNNGRGY